jgi:uncharacterized membrane protein
MMPAPSKTTTRQTERQPGRSYWPLVILAGITVVAFILRAYRIDFQSVWYDELFSLSVSRLPFPDMNRMLIQDLVHPPFHYYLMHWWFQVFGFGSLQARMLSLIPGVLAVLMIYELARYLFGRTTGLLSAFLLAGSQLTVMYAQEARPYSQCLLLVLTSAYCFLRGVRENSVRFWIAFVLSAILLVYTHYYGFFALGAIAAFALLQWKRYPISRAWVLSGVLGMMIAYTPWLASGLIREALYAPKFHLASPSSSAAPAPAAEHWYTPLTILNTFNNGRPNGVLDSAPLWTFVLGGVLFTLPAAIALMCLIRRRNRESGGPVEQANVVYLLLLSVIPIVVGLGIAHFAGIYAVRYFAFCAAPYYILVARGISLVRPAFRWGLILALLLYSGNALRANYTVLYKEDYRHAFDSIARDSQAGDCAVVAQRWEQRPARWAWSLYEDNRPGPEFRSLFSGPSVTEGCGRVWLVSVFHYGNPVAVKAGVAARQKLSEAFTLRETRRFFWIIVNLYSRGQ